MNESNSPGYIQSIASTRKKSKENLRVDQLIPSEILEQSGESGIKQLLEKYYEFMNMNEFIYNQDEAFTDVILDNVARFRIQDEANDNNQFFTDETGGQSRLIISSPDEVLPRRVNFVANSNNVDATLGTITVTEEQQAGLPVGAIVQYNAAFTEIGGLEHHRLYYIVYSLAGKIKLSDSRGGDPIIFTSTPGGNDFIIGVSSEIEIDLNLGNILITNGNELPGSLKRSESDIGKTIAIMNLHAFNGMSAELTTPITNWVGPGPSYILNSIEDAMDIDKNSNSVIDDSNQYLEMMQKEIAAALPRNVSSVNVNKNTLYKRIIDFYKIRGSVDSIETFFRLLFNEPVVTTKPYDNTLIPSTSGWSEDVGLFLNNKGFVSEKKIRLHDSYRYQKYSYLIKTGRNLSDWDNVFNRLVHPAGFIFFGEILILLENTRAILGDNTKGVTRGTKDPETGNIVDQLINAYGTYNFLERDNPRFTLSSMPGIQPGVIGIEDVPLLVEQFASIFGPTPEVHLFKSSSLSAQSVDSNGTITDIGILQAGSGYTVAPSTAAGTITVYGTNTTPAVITTTINDDGEIEEATIVNGGLGYDINNITISVSQPIDSDGNTVTQLSKIDLNYLDNKNYRQRPDVFIGVPQAVDETGELLPTNVQATAELIMEPAGVDYVTMINRGSGYTHSNIPKVTFSNPQVHYTRAPFYTEDFTNESIGNWYTSGIASTASIVVDPDDSNNTAVLKVQTSSSTFFPEIRKRLSVQQPDWTERLPGNTIRVKFKAKRPSSGGSATVQAAYLMQEGYGFDWQEFTFTGTDQWEEFSFEVTIPEHTAVQVDFIAFDSDEQNGIVYIDDIEVGVKYDLPVAFATLKTDGSIAGIVFEHAGGGYTSKPSVTIEGAATADSFLIPSEISSINITNHGHGYIREPSIRLGSAMDIEERVVDETVKLILSLNHTEDGSRILEDNNYFQRKGDSYYTSSKKFDMNQTIEFFGEQTVESNHINNINKYNVNSYIEY